jgi:peroxiredoxin Q/BCP
MNVLRTALGALLVMGLAATAPAADLQPGDDAPNFSMVGSDGKTYSLSDFKGQQVVVIAWFPKAFTGGCTKECKSMKEDGELLRAYNVAYFTASCDPREGEKGNAAFAESLGLDYPILCDPTKENAKAFGVSDGTKNATRWTFYIGANGKILYIDKAVKTDTHGRDIAARLDSLGVSKR